MYGSISTQQHKKYLSLISYKISGDDIGVVAGFFRILMNAIKLRNIQLSTIQSKDDIETTWIQLLQRAEDGLDVNVSKLDFSQLNLKQSYSSVNFMKLINDLIMSLPDQLKDLFVTKTQCQQCHLIQSSVTTMVRNKCSKCNAALHVIKSPTLLFQDPNNKSIQLKDKLIGGKLYVLNSVFTGKREKDELISYNILVDFLFLQNSEMFVLNVVESSKMRPSLTELTYLKGEKMRQYLADTSNQTAVYRKCGRPAVVCYFMYDHLTSFAQKNIQAEMDIEPEVILDRSVVQQPPKLEIKLPQPPQLPEPWKPPCEPEIPRRVVPEEVAPPQNVIKAQSLQKPKFFNCGWIIIGILALAMLFFIISLIIMIVIFVRLNTTISLNGAIIQSKLFMTQAVNSPNQINAYLQSLPEPPGTYQGSNPLKPNIEQLNHYQSKKQSPIVQNLKAQNTPNGIYVDNVTSSKIVSNYSKIDTLSGMQAYCASQQLTNLSQLPANISVTANSVQVTNLIVTNLLNASQKVNFGTGINISQLRITGQLNATSISGTGTGVVSSMACTGMFSQETLNVANGNFGTFEAQGNVEVNTSYSANGYKGTSFYASSIEPGCIYQCNGSLHAKQLYVEGANAQLVFGPSASLQNSLSFSNSGATLRINGTNVQATTSVTQTTGTLYGTVNANQLSSDQMTVATPITVQNITANTTNVANTTIALTMNAQSSTLTNVVNAGTSINVTGVLEANANGATLTATASPLQMGQNAQVSTPNDVTFTNGAVGSSVSFQGATGITQNQNLTFNTATVAGQTSATNVNINGPLSVPGSLTTTNMQTNMLQTPLEITVQNMFKTDSYGLTNYLKNPVMFLDTDGQIKAWFDIAYSNQWQVQNGSIEQCSPAFLAFLKK